MQQGTETEVKNTHGLDIAKIRSDFPMLTQKLNGNHLFILIVQQLLTSQRRL